jgi:hypothetical protein
MRINTNKAIFKLTTTDLYQKGTTKFHQVGHYNNLIHKQ